MVRKEFLEIGGKVVARVTFALPSSIWADAIYLVGDFNQWGHQTGAMREFGERMTEPSALSRTWAR